jgi:hypothetical protein
MAKNSNIFMFELNNSFIILQDYVICYFVMCLDKIHDVSSLVKKNYEASITESCDTHACNF